MAHRTVKGIGTAFYLPHEERFAQRLLAGASPTRFNELGVLHALKVFTGGCLLPEEAEAAPIVPDPEQMELA